MDPTTLTLAGLRTRVRAGDLRPSEVAAAYLRRLHALEPSLHAFLHVDDDAVVTEARAWDGRAAEAPLAGIPIALKDNLCTRGTPTTCASRILEGWVPPYDATVVTRLRGAGAVVLGKTNMDEFAMGSSTENSAFGPVRNPWDRERVPGGSSGGSAAAVAAGAAPAALGSDTGGSVRQPAAFCGVVGLKPTYGRVSRYGLVAFASSLDQIGPVARTVEDAALLLGCIAGHDPADATSVDAPVPDYAAALAGGVRGLRIGVPREAMGEGLEPAVRDAVESGVAALRYAGAEVVDVALPHLEHALAAYYIIAPAEASSNLARYDGVRYGLRVRADDVRAMVGRTRARGFGPEVRRRIMLGTYALAAGYYEAYYLRAQRVRTLIVRDFQAAFARADAIAMPATPTLPFRLGERVDDPLQMYLADVYTIPVNLAGLPGVSVPCATRAGLPVGLQIVGRAFDEATILRAARVVEEAADLPHLWRAAA